LYNPYLAGCIIAHRGRSIWCDPVLRGTGSDSGDVGCGRRDRDGWCDGAMRVSVGGVGRGSTPWPSSSVSRQRHRHRHRQAPEHYEVEVSNCDTYPIPVQSRIIVDLDSEIFRFVTCRNYLSIAIRCLSLRLHHESFSGREKDAASLFIHWTK
jgi:hypothetical protein